jgi:hypothetical protein
MERLASSILDDTSIKFNLLSSCSECKNADRVKIGTCKAFPDGIPEEIWIGKNDHKNSYPGDNGIQFEPIE